MQHVLSLGGKSDVYSQGGERSGSSSITGGEEDISRLVECMALNSSTTSEEGSEVSEIDSFLVEGSEEGEVGPEPEYLLPRTPPLSPASQNQETADPETQVARLEALLEAAGISKLAENKQLADPEVLKRLTSSVSSALDEAAATLTRMRTEPGPGEGGTSLVAACTQGDISRVRRLLDEGRVSVHETTEEGESLLSLACSAGYYELAQVLLAMRANVEDRGMKGDCTPLMEAASAGHTDIVRLLIAHGADVNAQSSTGNTPLMYACAGGHEEVVRVLLEAGANVEVHNENGHTPLMEAASAGHCGVAKILLEFGAGINTHSNEFKESALTLACYKGHLEMVRFLLEAGADQEHKTDEMHTALMEASMDGHVEVARLLLDSGAQVNMPADSFESPLTLAACGGHVELAMLLLERGANIEEVNDEGYTPLMEASREGHEEMVALLLSQGADINAQTEETQETALTLACCGGFLEVADFLIKAGADLELGASTPLMEASQEGHLELVRYLLEARADVNATTGTGDTALTYACENGHTDVADLLLQFGAQLEHESEGGRTPLMKAARAGHLCTVQFLISRGADVSRQTSNNDHTPLSLACAGGHLNVVEVLLQQGADPHHKLKDNSTMLIEAAKGGHTGVVQMLIDYPNSLVAGGVAAAVEAQQQTITERPHPLPISVVEERVPPPGSEVVAPPTKVSGLRIAGGATRKGAGVPSNGGSNLQPNPAFVKGGSTAALANVPNPAPDSGYDILESKAGYLLDLERQGVDAKSYIQAMLRETEGSTHEKQIIQKEQILAELQRVEKELQEKASTQAHLLSSEPAAATRNNKREAGEGREASEGGREVGEGASQEELSAPSTFSLSLDQPISSPNTEVIQLPNMSNQLCLSGRSLATLPPSERPKAKASRKIDGVKKSQLQAALQQHSQQLAQLQQLQQLNQQLQQQVIQQRQLKQQNQQTLANLQQNAIANQQQLASLQQNVAQLQQLEQTILAQQTTAHQQQHQQLQQRVQQIMQQKQELQHQIKQFQLQVEKQLEFTQHAGPVSALTVPGPPPPLPSGPPPPPPGGSKKRVVGREGGDGEEVEGEVCTTDPHYIISDQFITTSGGVAAGIDPSLLTSAAFELVQASQALQAVQAVPPILHADSPPMMTPLTQDPSLLSSMDPAQIAAAVQHCPIPLDSPLQVATSGGVSVQYSSALTGLPVLSSSAAVNSSNQLPDCGQHAQPIINPITNPGFGHELFLPTNLACAFGNGNGQLLLDGGPGTGPAAFQHQLPPGTTDLDILGFSNQVEHDVKNLHEKKAGGGGKKKISPPAIIDPNYAAAAGAPFVPADSGGYAAGYAPPAAGVNVVDLDSETDSNHDTALTLACAGGHEELVTLLLSRGADNEHRDKKGFTPLILAATAGHDKVVDILLNHGADIEAQSERTKDTPLSLACSGGRYEVVEILLARGANKEHRNVSDYTPLSLAASGGYTNIIKLLLAHGAEINSRTGSKLGISPLMLAAMNGHTAAVKLLLDMGSDINAQIETNRNTALTLACFQGRHEVVSLLLDRKANVEHRAKTGLTPLMEAASGGYTEVGRVLLDKGADVNAAPVPSSRDTALTIAADKGHYRFVELLLSRGAQVDVRNKKGNSSLWLAANGGHLDVVQLLYSAGADIDSQDNRKVSCLMAAFRKGHSKVVKWLVKHVTQFPSDQELTRFIATISDKDLLKKTHQCLEIIRVAKDRQASEANKAANILLEELEQEKTREESKKAAAARKREKKKRKKAEKKGNQKDDEDEDEDEKEEVKENGDFNTEDEKEKSPEILESEVTINELNRDSGIDANSQGSVASNEKEEINKGKKKKKNKKSKEKEKNEKNEEKKQEEKENNNLAANRGDSKEKSPEEEERPDSRNDRNSQPRVPCTIEGHSAPEPEKPQPVKELGGFIEPVRKGRRSVRQAQETDVEMVSSKVQVISTSTKKGATAGGKANVTDAGWKEVVRKSKKVSVPSNAISRVIGRGGSNINAIRELSGAHIEVEKQSKVQGDRTILIKGSADATRLANTWISAIISNPEKDLQEIVGKAQYKQLSAACLAKANPVGSAVASKTIVKTTIVSSTVSTTRGKSGEMKKQTVTAVISTATKVTLAYSTPVMTASKTKPVTSTSFAAIAAGNDNLGMIPTGPPPASAAMKAAAANMPLKSSAAASKPAKKEETISSAVAAAAAAANAAAAASTDPKDFSPFKTFNMSQGFGWNSAAVDKGPKGFATNGNQSSVTSSQPDVSKAPGYRMQGGGSGSPNITSEIEWATSANQAPMAPPTSSYRTSSGSSDPAANQLYPAQERCNSAPGTPVSPLVPPPIAPPTTNTAATPTPKAGGGGSPGSDSSWFRPVSGNLGPNLRSMTPDGELDRRWGGLEDVEVPRRQGSGSYGHNSPAKAPGGHIPDLFGRNINKQAVDSLAGLETENLLSAAAQLSNLSNFENLMTSAASSNSVSIAPGIPMPDISGVGGYSSRMLPPMRFTAPPLTNTTPAYSQPQGMSIPVVAGLPKGLNPNAPDFAQGGLYNQGLRSSLPPRAPGMMNGPGTQKMPGTNAFAGFGGANQFGTGVNNFQSIITNQGINAYLSQFGQSPNNTLDMVNTGLADLTLSGKSLSELSDILGPESPYPSNLTDSEPKFSRPIGAERQRTGPSPLGGMPTMPTMSRKVDPFTVWEFPPSYTDNMHPNSNHQADSFSGLIPTLSGQTLSSLDNLSKAGYDTSALNHFNNVGPAPSNQMVDPGTIGGGPPHNPSSGFGMPPANLTPNKADYSDWGSAPGSAPGSANKNMAAAPGYVERGDTASVRRNINQNQMWPKNWEE